MGINNVIFNKTIDEIPESMIYCRDNNMAVICSSFIPSGRTKKGSEEQVSAKELQEVFEKVRKIDEEKYGIIHSGLMPFIGQGDTCNEYLGLLITILGDVVGCVGKTEEYGNVKNGYTLKQAWEKRLPLLQKYKGGCPPRQKFYESLEGSDFSKFFEQSQTFFEIK